MNRERTTDTQGDAKPQAILWLIPAVPNDPLHPAAGFALRLALPERPVGNRFTLLLGKGDLCPCNQENVLRCFYEETALDLPAVDSVEVRAVVERAAPRQDPGGAVTPDPVDVFRIVSGVAAVTQKGAVPRSGQEAFLDVQERHDHHNRAVGQQCQHEGHTENNRTQSTGGTRTPPRGWERGDNRPGRRRVAVLGGRFLPPFRPAIDRAELLGKIWPESGDELPVRAIALADTVPRT